jgi:hypothetical protein
MARPQPRQQFDPDEERPVYQRDPPPDPVATIQDDADEIREDPDEIREDQEVDADELAAAWEAGGF